MKNTLLLALFLGSFSCFANPDSTNYCKSVETLLKFSRKQLHVHYHMGGTSRKGFDCSGFMQQCFSKVGVKLPHSSAAQSTQGSKVAVAHAQPGDLIFFKGSNSRSARVGHVGMVVEATGKYIKFVHAAIKGGVRYDFLHAKYYQKRFMGIKRVL